MTESAQASYFSRFETYFAREIAEKAASSLADRIEIQFQVANELFTFTRTNKKNQLLPAAANAPQFEFTLTALAANQILEHPAATIPEIGIEIAKLLLSPDANTRIRIKLNAGLMQLFTLGYFGILTQGGSEFMAFLAKKGFDGVGAIKSALGKLRQ